MMGYGRLVYSITLLGDPKTKYIKNMLIDLLYIGGYLGLLTKKRMGSSRAFLIK